MNTVSTECNNLQVVIGLLQNIAEALNKPAESNTVEFYNINQVVEMTGWSENTVQKLFNDPKFPSSDFGKTKIIEKTALLNYFSMKHIKSRDRYWK